MDRLTLRLEAARIASQTPGVNNKNIVQTAKRLERYIEGNAELEEHFSEEEVIQKIVHKAMLEMTGANDAVRKFEETDKELHRKFPILNDLHDTPVFDAEKQMPPFTTEPVNKKYDPAFVSNLMKACTTHPTDNGELNAAVRERYELYHDMGLAPEPFDTKDLHPDLSNVQGMAYLAPGGMPCAEAESMFLQQKGTE